MRTLPSLSAKPSNRSPSPSSTEWRTKSRTTRKWPPASRASGSAGKVGRSWPAAAMSSSFSRCSCSKATIAALRQLEPEVVGGAEDAAATEDPGDLRQHAVEGHPLEGLRRCDEVRAAVRQRGPVRGGADIPDIRRLRRLLRVFPHRVVQLDADDFVGSVRPEARREPAPTAEVDHEPRPVCAGERRQQLEQRRRRMRPIAVVVGCESGPPIRRRAEPFRQPVIQLARRPRRGRRLRRPGRA
jgi:hypothetical protein